MLLYLQLLPRQHLVVLAGRRFSAVQPSRSRPADLQALCAAPQCHAESHPTGRVKTVMDLDRVRDRAGPSLYKTEII